MKIKKKNLGLKGEKKNSCPENWERHGSVWLFQIQGEKISSWLGQMRQILFLPVWKISSPTWIGPIIRRYLYAVCIYQKLIISLSQPYQGGGKPLKMSSRCEWLYFTLKFKTCSTQRMFLHNIPVSKCFYTLTTFSILGLLNPDPSPITGVFLKPP